MSLLLQNHKSIISITAVRIIMFKYRNSESDTPHTEIVTMSDSTIPVTINTDGIDEHYVPMGSLMSITSVKNELVSTESQVSIGLSGLPEGAIWKMLNNPIKNSRVNIYRVYYDTITGQLINTQKFGKFTGLVNYYTIEDSPGNPGTCNIIMICNNKTTDLNRVLGRSTGPLLMKRYFPTDVSFDRVVQLVGARYNFGAPEVIKGVLK